MKKYLETGLMILCAAAFFGFIYPELCLTTDTVRVIESNNPETKEIKPKETKPEETTREQIRKIYTNRSTPPQIRIRSRIWDETKLRFTR